MTTLDLQLFLLLNADDDAHDWVIDGGQFFAAHAHWLLLVLLFVMALRRSRPLLRPIGVAALAIAFGALACELIPLAWDRPRPFERGLGVLHLPHSGSPSFPSSHATAYGALAFSFVLDAKLRWVGGTLLALAVLVSLARVVVGVHYPFDIVIGAGLGGLAAVAAHSLVERVSWRVRTRSSSRLS